MQPQGAATVFQPEGDEIFQELNYFRNQEKRTKLSKKRIKKSENKKKTKKKFRKIQGKGTKLKKKGKTLKKKGTKPTKLRGGSLVPLAPPVAAPDIGPQLIPKNPRLMIKRIIEIDKG